MTGAAICTCLFAICSFSRYFDDPWQNLPKDGYTKMFENMLLKDPKITVRVSRDFFK